jgi:hypothetical protein
MHLKDAKGIILICILKGIGWPGLDLSGSLWEAVPGSCEQDYEPMGSLKAEDFMISEATASFSRRTVFHAARYKFSNKRKHS